MIESITISKASTFDNAPEILSGLSKFNYVFGANGTGKTTISRVIANEKDFPFCSLTWKAGTKLETLVYNRDFVETNFNQSAELKGVFTLGEKQVEIVNKIAAAKAELDGFVSEIENLRKGLEGDDGKGGKHAESVALETWLRDKCWAQKQKHDPKLQGAFEGYRGSAEKFKTKVLQELNSNSSALVTLAELEKRAETVFGPTPTAERLIPNVDISGLITHEGNPILTKRVIGKEDVDIAAMIKRLGNSDWVKEGKTFYEVNEQICPFCQQKTTEAFAKSLGDYFDEAFVNDSKAINDLATNYGTDASRIQQQINSIISSASKFLDVEKLKLEKEILDSKIAINNQRLSAKKKEASQVVELDSISNVSDSIKALIESANNLIAEHNKTVANLAQPNVPSMEICFRGTQGGPG